MSFIISDNTITSLGSSTEEVLASIEAEKTGIRSTEYKSLTEAPISVIDRNKLPEIQALSGHTFFEQIAILSISRAIKNTNVQLDTTDTLLIVSTTKGNIELLNEETTTEDGLVASAAQNIANYFNCANTPQVVCNACISGVLALTLAHRYISSNFYKNVVVVGADIVSNFVVAGFESFKSMSNIPCQPFDKERKGLSLGEGAGTIILSKENNQQANAIKIVGGSSANDANHISGPSRTGEGAYLSASRALNNNFNVDFISAHGTATPYNDDMESIAITRLGLQDVPTNSFKGYFGHTLGAAGVIESILTIRSMQNNRIFKTLGCEEKGTANSINIIQNHKNKVLTRCLKIASGFGGCNAAIVFEKHA